jgi:hypothetical protein
MNIYDNLNHIVIATQSMRMVSFRQGIINLWHTITKDEKDELMSALRCYVDCIGGIDHFALSRPSFF